MYLDPEIHNFYEHLVAQYIHELELDESRDPDFLSDLICLSLNKLPAHYIRHDVDMCTHISDTDRDKMAEEVATAVQQAYNLLKKDRRHREDDE